MSTPHMPIETDRESGAHLYLLDKPGYHAKHEQFSRDSRNRVLIQLNQLPDVKQVLLGELSMDGQERLFATDRPYTPRPTGHEAWVGTSDRVLFSSASDPKSSGNIWSVKVDESQPTLVHLGTQRFGHVSVSRCGATGLAMPARKAFQSTSAGSALVRAHASSPAARFTTISSGLMRIRT